ncbi:MAG: hypothetical protein QOD00_2523, partial [Blastocatellia bacterium]|nr:hypothetical protein [Blastocatellia bacterium]
MRKLNHQEREPAQSDGAQKAAETIADTLHPSHYQARKEDIKTERQLHQEASDVAPANASPAAHAQPPEEFTGIEVKPLSKAAGGVPAVLNTMKFAWREMGAVRGARTLLQLNQKDGFDCPGCAWPDPDGERSHTEFCENGAKHVADEATTKRITPEFFKQWSIADLSSKSDYWLGQ